MAVQSENLDLRTAKLRPINENGMQFCQDADILATLLMTSKTPIQWLRTIGFYEGISFVLLMFIAMPLKYLANQPLAVSVVGMAHGVLFIGYCAALVWARWNGLAWKEMVIAFVAALLPFGPFVIDGRLKRLDAASTAS